MDRVKWLLGWWWKDWVKSSAPPFFIVFAGAMGYFIDGYVPTLEQFIENCFIIYILPLAGSAILAMYAVSLIVAGFIVELFWRIVSLGKK